MFYKKWISLAACIFLLLLLAGCGKTPEKAGIEGVYELSQIQEQRMTLPISLMEDDNICLEISEGGSGIVHLQDSDGFFRWTYSEGSITIKADSWEANGDINDKTMILTFPSGAQALFSLVTDQDTVEYRADVDDGGFSGNWYGWLKIETEDSTFPKSWYDCCAKVIAVEDKSIQIIIWDEDGSLQDPLGEITMNLQPDGSAVSENGYFCYADIAEDEWVMLCPDSFSPPAIQITNCTHDAMGEIFSYSFVLHPWGTEWENDPESQENVFLPFYYYDWYLPLIEEKTEMPDQIPWEILEELRTSGDTGE